MERIPRGRKLTKNLSGVSDNITVSWPKAKIHILESINEMIKNGGVNMSRSELIVSCVESVYRSGDISKLEDLILDRYAERILVGPKLFKTFQDVLEWEIRDKSVKEIITLWGISPEDMSKIFFRFCYRLRDL